MSNERIRVIVLLLLSVVVLCSILLLHINYTNNSKILDNIKQTIEKSGWPIEEVPVLYKTNLELIKSDSTTYVQKVLNGVSFTEFVKYLNEISDVGFEADKFYGCKDPALINVNADLEKIDKFIWVGFSEKYRIIATWENESKDNSGDSVWVTLNMLDDVEMSLEK